MPFCLLSTRISAHKFGFEHWRLHSINGHATCTKPMSFADKLIHFLSDENIGDQTKGFAGAEYYAHRWSVLEIGQLKPNRFCRPASYLWTPPMGNAEWRLPDVPFNWLPTIGHFVMQKGVLCDCELLSASASREPVFRRYHLNGRIDQNETWAQGVSACDLSFCSIFLEQKTKFLGFAIDT